MFETFLGEYNRVNLQRLVVSHGVIGRHEERVQGNGGKAKNIIAGMLVTPASNR